MVTAAKDEGINLVKEKSPEMKMYEAEKLEQRRALIALGDMIAQNSIIPGLDTTKIGVRARKCIEDILKQNEESANREFTEKYEENGCKPFIENGLKFSKNADSVKITIVGSVAKEIKELEAKAKEFNDKIDVLKKGAKAAGKNIRRSVTPAKVKYKIGIVAPKEKPEK